MLTRARLFLRNSWPAVIVFAVALAVYSVTLCPTLFVEGSGENIVCVWTLGVPHPPGFPLFCLLGRAFAGLISVGEPAFRVNLFSAVMGATAAAGLFLLIITAGVGRIAAAAAALTYAFSATFWRQAVIAEVYTLSTGLVMVQIGLLLHWSRARRQPVAQAPASHDKQKVERQAKRHGVRDRDAALLWFGLAFGLGLTVHYIHVLLLPAYAFFVAASDRTVFRRWRTLAGAVGMAAVGFSLHVYAPLRSRADPPIDWGNPETLANWWSYLTAAQYRGKMFHLPLQSIASNLWSFFARLPAELTWPGLAAALAGIGVIVRRDKALFGLLALMIVLALVWATNYDIPWEIDVYYLPAVLGLAVFVAVGVDWAVRSASARKGLKWAPVLSLVLPVLALYANLARNDLSEQGFVLDNALDVLDAVESGSAVVLPTTNPTFALLYLKHVEHSAAGVELWCLSDSGVAPAEKAVSPLQERESVPLPRLVVDSLARGVPVYTVDRQPAGSVAGFQQLPWGCVYRVVRAGESALWRESAPGALEDTFRFDANRQLSWYGAEHELIACRYLLVKADYAWERGRQEAADDLYQEALKLGDDLPSVIAQVGQRYVEQGRSDLAAAVYEAGLAKHDDALLHNRLGAIYGRANRLEDAQQHFERALELKPDCADAHANLASVYGRRGETERAVAELEEALRIDRSNVLALKNLAHAYAQTGRKEQAKDLLLRSLDINPAQEDVRSYLRVLETD